MIMFYDVMLIDDDPVLHRAHKERRLLLENLVTSIKWKVGLVWHQEVGFSTPKGPKLLKRALAYAFVQRWEGLILKPTDESYLDLARPVRGRFPSRWIKLKKDCIKGLGDTADFAVVGAGYDVKEAAKYPYLKLKWTHFYIGCLRNKGHVLHSAAKPQFLVFDKVSDCIKKDDLVYLNQHGQFPLRSMDPGSDDASAAFEIEYAMGLTRPQTIFRKPFVFDVAGSGFDKSPKRDIFTLRFPRVMKVHYDRDWKQAVSLDELQAMATEARTTPSKESVSGEVKAWVEKLDQLDRGAKGQMPSWDYTNDEDEDHVGYVEDISATPKPQQARRARTAAAPTLVRMDSGEMRDQERRLDSGEVVDQPTSKHSMSSNTSDASLPTPPSSSPPLKGSSIRSRQLCRANTDGHSSANSKKRSVDAADMEEGSRRSKKARPPHLQQTKSEPNPRSNFNEVQKTPLGEITNCARPLVPPPSIKQPRESALSPTTDFSLVRKVAVGSDEHLRRLQKKPRIVMEPSSPARETTASLSTLASTTQQTESRDAVSAPAASPVHKAAETIPLTTPPSTAERPFIAVQIRKLQKCNLILSPSRAEVGGHPLKELLAKHSIPHSPYPGVPSSSTSTSPADAKDNSNIYVLVDPADTQVCGKHMWRLVPNVPFWHPKFVMVRDWRFVEAILNDNIGDGEAQKRMAKECFFAKISWNPEWGSQGAVEVQWHDWSISRVLKEELERFQVLNVEGSRGATEVEEG